MAELANFPHISQRDSDVNADFDCVPASLAMCLQWLTGRKYTAQEIKDAVYGASYTGGTAASAYVAYCAAQGVTLAPVNGNGTQLVAALKSAISAQHPVILTEPDPYMPAADGYSHVCAAYKFDSGSITVVDPWIDQDVTKSDATWASQLEFNQIWTLERKMQVPQGWHDANNTLTAPNGHKVVLGFRDHVLNYPGGWNPGNQPLEEEWHADPLEVSNPSLGAGQKQGFNETTLEYTASRGVFEAFQGQEIVALRALLAKAGTGTASVDTSAVEADINAIVDAVAAPAAKALADLKKL